MLLAGITALAVALGLWSAAAWGAGRADQAQLLPGISIDDIDVGDLNVTDAARLVEDALDARLDQPIVVVHDGRQWTTTARRLGATHNLDVVLEEALALTEEVNAAQLAGIRWLGREADLSLQVSIDSPDDARAATVDAIADAIDRDPIDGDLRWVDGDVMITGDRDGVVVDRTELDKDLLAAVTVGTDEPIAVVSVPVVAELTSTSLQIAQPLVQQAADEALDRPITVSADGRTWDTSPRALGAVPDLAPLLQVALNDTGVVTQTSVGTTGGPSGMEQEVPLRLAGDHLDVLVDEVAETVYVAARDASLDTSSGWIQIVSEAAGQALSRDDATALLLDAVHGTAQEVELPIEPVAPQVTRDDYHKVVLVRRDQRRIYLYVDGEISRSWPVAVGASSSPTPTGTFVVGDRRNMPTWVNPSPNGWGRDMPARIGPGPTNPLGVRALNWNVPGGGDTLIRFHGTPNTRSIGSATSNGCVRMYNSDVIELYDLVPSGTTIVSLG